MKKSDNVIVLSNCEQVDIKTFLNLLLQESDSIKNMVVSVCYKETEDTPGYVEGYSMAMTNSELAFHKFEIDEYLREVIKR